MQEFRPNWELLRELRLKYLEGARATVTDYWSSDEVLENYDRTFGARIGWKWNAVLSHLQSLGWPGPNTPAAESARLQLVDYACGTGQAARAWIRHLGTPSKPVQLVDRSALACQFAASKLAEENCPSESRSSAFAAGSLVLVSHLFTELPRRARSALVQELLSAEGFVWLEPGTPAASEFLVELRAEFLKQGFVAIAPCPHQGICGLEKKSKDWCHFFASPAPEAFTSAFWGNFSRELSIDLRSLPVSFLVMQKRGVNSSASAESASRPSIALGRPRFQKGRTLCQVCEEGTVREISYQNRLYPDWIEALQTQPFVASTPPIHREGTEGPR